VRYVGSLEEGVLLVPPGSLLAAVVSPLPNVVVRGVFAFCLMELVCLMTEELLVETPRDAVPWVKPMFSGLSCPARGASIDAVTGCGPSVI
jgi:hypothetical protein